MDFKERQSQQEEIKRLEKEIEGRLKHIAYLKTSPERVSRWRKCVRILELFRGVIATGSGFVALTMTFSFFVLEFRNSTTNYTGDDYLWMTMTLFLWLILFLEMSKEYYDKPPTKLGVE
jgi:hypothetical protein